MKTLLSTTALALILGLPTLALAQTAVTTTAQTEANQTNSTSGFLSARTKSDILASDLIGHDVYAQNAETAQNSSDTQSTMNADGMQEMTTMMRGDLDNMENIGQINEIVVSNDGQVRALVIGVGGFLGMGEQDVALTMDQVKFATDSDDPSQMYILVNTRMEDLKAAPAYDRSVANMDDAQANTNETTAMAPDTQANPETNTQEANNAAGANRTTFTAPTMEREGFYTVDVKEVTTEMLMEQSVYDVNDNDVGDVTDMIIDDKGAITNVIIDFGGFLGMGESQASLGYEELTIMTNDDQDEVRIYVDATKEEIQALPRHLAAN